MSYDPKLVEAVARNKCRRTGIDPDMPIGGLLAWETCRPSVEEDLAAIDASGVAWVAPWDATAAMLAGYVEAVEAGLPDRDTLAAIRDACLAERRAAARSPANAPRTREDESAGVIGHKKRIAR